MRRRQFLVACGAAPLFWPASETRAAAATGRRQIDGDFALAEVVQDLALAALHGVFATADYLLPGGEARRRAYEELRGVALAALETEQDPGRALVDALRGRFLAVVGQQLQVPIQIDDLRLTTALPGQVFAPVSEEVLRQFLAWALGLAQEGGLAACRQQAPAGSDSRQVLLRCALEALAERLGERVIRLDYRLGYRDIALHKQMLYRPTRSIDMQYTLLTPQPVSGGCYTLCGLQLGLGGVNVEPDRCQLYAQLAAQVDIGRRPGGLIDRIGSRRVAETVEERLTRIDNLFRQVVLDHDYARLRDILPGLLRMLARETG